jgi:DNA repair exonuclease SbcCD ATPase subunit
MKEVKLKRIEISNFKGVRSLTVDFKDGATTISGRNGKGKSTIYNAYLWCLFGKGQNGTVISVQPKDTENNIIHKLENSVEVTLQVAGDVVRIKRVQREDWSVPKGKTEEVFKGNVVERYYNDVPCSVKEFGDKLNAICNVDDWFILSSIIAFMSLKQEDRRKKLISIAGDINEAEILDKYTRLKQEVSKGKSVDEVLRQTKSSIKRMQEDHDFIPARIDQQSKLIVDKDFKELENQLQTNRKEQEEIESTILGIDRSSETDQYQKELADVRKQINDIVSTHQNEVIRKTNELKRNITKVEEDIKSHTSAIDTLEQKKKQAEAYAEDCEKEFKTLQEAWQKKNKEDFEEEVSTTCILCGAALPQDKIKEAQDKALKIFNEEKVAELNRLVKRAEGVKAEINDSRAKVAQYEKEIAEKNKEIESLEKLGKEYNNLYITTPTADELIENNKAIAQLRKEEDAIKAKINSCNNPETSKIDELRLKKSELKAKETELVKELNQKDINNKCKELIKELEESSRNLANNISELSGLEQEIKDYKKELINKTEANVSQYFEMVRWKMYEPNISNDGEKEICQAIIDGKSYEEQNTAMQVNAGVDIINGLSEALGIAMPLFVDNAESVNELLQARLQTIQLKVTFGELTIE